MRGDAIKAIVIKEPQGEVTVEEREKPTPGLGQVLIRVHACGVCHSDLGLLEGAFPFAQFPIVPGHEVAGVVEEIGEGVEWPQTGARVGMPWLYSSCGHCEQCTHGDEVLCPEIQVTGITQDGGYAEFMLAPAAYVAPIPDSLDFADAAPLMCAGLTVYNGLRNANFKPGDRVAVIGLGGLGHLGILYARAMGGRVAVLSGSPDKEEEARGLGAEHFISTRDGSISETLLDWEGGADIILATSPSAELMTEALPGLAPDGTLAVLGAAPDGITVNPMDLISARRHLMGSPSGSRKDIRDALDFAVTHDVKPKITPRPLKEAGEVLHEMHEGRLRGRVVLTTT
jgi:D-arabinose 1-dehydrogenase-like Zn-dependent alcohol dehydrogenase